MLSTALSGASISRHTNNACNPGMDVRQIRRDNLRELVRRYGTQAALAERIGTSPAYISQLLSTRVRANVGHAMARQIEALLALAPGWMDVVHDMADTPGQYTVPTPDQRPPGQGASDRIPIVGEIDDGPVLVAGSQNDEHLDAPAPYPGVYALRVRGSAMSPRIREGDAVSVSPRAEPAPGEEIVLRLRDGEHTVRQLVSARADEIIVCNADGAARRLIPRGDIEYMHAVIGIHPPSQVRKR